MSVVDENGDPYGPGSWQPGAFNGFVMTVASGPAITSLSYDSGSMPITSYGFDSTTLSFNFAAQSGGVAVFNVGTGPAPVPLPASSLIFAPALAMLGLFGVRRRKART